MSEENRYRKEKITIRLTEEERDIIYEKYKLSNLKSIREFIIKMINKGYVIKLDLSEILEITTAINKIGTNINQIVFNANLTQNISNTKLDELIKLLSEVNKKQDEILSKIYLKD